MAKTLTEEELLVFLKKYENETEELREKFWRGFMGKSLSGMSGLLIEFIEKFESDKDRAAASVAVFLLGGFVYKRLKELEEEAKKKIFSFSASKKNEDGNN